MAKKFTFNASTDEEFERANKAQQRYYLNDNKIICIDEYDHLYWFECDNPMYFEFDGFVESEYLSKTMDLTDKEQAELNELLRFSAICLENDLSVVALNGDKTVFVNQDNPFVYWIANTSSIEKIHSKYMKLQKLKNDLIIQFQPPTAQS